MIQIRLGPDCESIPKCDTEVDNDVDKDSQFTFHYRSNNHGAACIMDGFPEVRLIVLWPNRMCA